MGMKVNLNGILNELKSIFDLNNTSTSANDLSASMEKRVQKVLTVHPNMIPIQASFYPFVTCYVSEKPIDANKGDFAKDQVNAQRRADLDIDIVGAVWNQLTTDVTKDSADTEINNLMENVEWVLRNYPSLNGQVKWQFPKTVKYFSQPINEQTHLRAGIMPIKLTIYY